MGAITNSASASGSQNIRLALPFELLQALRLAHAVMESDFVVHISSREEAKFSYLRRFFDFRYVVDNANVPVLAGVTVSHVEPETCVGKVKRPLIFPAAIIQRCRSLWSNERPVGFSFQGFLTSQRRNVLEKWIVSSTTAREAPLDWRAPIHDERLKLDMRVSDTGRHFPEKLWDEEYYRSLAQSKFVLCPSGDCKWSYRFFEAVLCGAIPVAEQACATYEGFQYELMSEDVRDLQWSEDIAMENFARAVERLTLSGEEMHNALREEVSRAQLGYDDAATEANPWYEISIAARELATLVSRSESLILLDQDAWREILADSGCVVRPFLECDGCFAGMPADDEVARCELERMRAEGAALFVFARPSFWALDYYSPFTEYLRQHFCCVLQNRRLVAFDLRSRK